ncbi:hypothetical protein Ciccas_004748 [Cichlidogyrus casuarinus]|uniref:histone acetyltransferase n=1 Tax=Cichlidogyrus casuarinus TaxID=1844966 RepID=A0ABD2QBF8_9PLAT
MQRPASDQACTLLKSEGPGLSSNEVAERQQKYEKSRQHLFCLYHAHNCRQEELANRPVNCNKPFCQFFRQVIAHISTCNMGSNCQEQLCFTSKRLVHHWQSCQKIDCALCGPISQSRSAAMSFNSRGASRLNAWQKNFQPAQRYMAVKTFVSFVFPGMKEPPTDDPRMIKFTQSIKEIEKDLFIKSPSMEDYINGLVDKCQKIILDSQTKGSTHPNREEGHASHSDIKERFQLDLGLSTMKQDPEFEDVKPRVFGGSSSTVKQEEALIKKEEEPMSEQAQTMEIKVEPKEDKPVPTLSSHQGKSAQPPTKAKNLKTWEPKELEEAFMPLLDKLWMEKDAEPFLQSVEDLVKIPQYAQIVTNPIDLPMIKQGLLGGRYSDPWGIVDDFWLMFNNAWLFNKKLSKVYRNCSKLAEVFEEQANPLMQSLGFCCAREEIFLPQILNCTTVNLCRINRDAVYYQFTNANKTDTGLCMDKYPICEKCYNDAYTSSKFEKMRNSRKEPEPNVYCRECGRKWHQICGCHMDEIWSKGFICPSCTQSLSYKRAINPYTASKLPTTKLSSFIETRVRKFLQRNASENIGEVFIRVLASSDKVVEVKPGMKARYCETGEMTDSFPYRVKAIFAFQVIDGQEVCFFGLHVQEYGSEAPPPNNRRVYIAYLDSVYYFQPKQLRTAVYHEILVSYLNYARIMRFTMAHIWACPPSEGDDYIFHMHPPDQKIPKPKRLQEWYQAMLKKAQTENIVVDYKDICKDACTNMTVSPTDLPYFEGDYWPNALEEIFKEIDDEEKKRQKEQVLYQEDEDQQQQLDDDSTQSPGSSCGGPNSNQSCPGGAPMPNGGAKKNQRAKKRKLKKGMSNGSHSKKKKGELGGVVDMNQEVSKRVYDMMEKHKDNFFVIRLYSANQATQLPSIKDPDRLITSELMDSRDTFLNYARDKHLEFSTLRRAKYSTLHMLYDIHNLDKPALYTCNKCSLTLDYRWHCQQCEEFDLCQKCKDEFGHEHPLKKLGPEDAKAGDERQDPLGTQSSNEKLQRLTQAFTHSINCRDSNCRQQMCSNLKRLLAHLKQHQDRNCVNCRRVMICSAFHCKTCNVPNCSFPMCAQMKQTMRNNQLQQRAQQSKLVRRRMAMMQRSMSNNNNAQNDNGQVASNSSPSPASAHTPAMVGAPTTPYGTQHSMQSPQHAIAGKIPHHSPLPASSPYCAGQGQQNSPYQMPAHHSPQTSMYSGSAGGGKPSGPSPGQAMYNAQNVPYAATQRQLSQGPPQITINKSMSVPSGMVCGTQPPNVMNRMQQSRMPMTPSKSPGAVSVAPNQWGQRMPGPGPQNISANDIQTVQRCFSAVQAKGQSMEEFFKWLSCNPNFLRAWQYLQSQDPNMIHYAQSQPEQQFCQQQAVPQQQQQMLGYQQQPQQQRMPHIQSWQQPQQMPNAQMRYRAPPPPQQQQPQVQAQQMRSNGPPNLVPMMQQNGSLMPAQSPMMMHSSGMIQGRGQPQPQQQMLRGAPGMFTPANMSNATLSQLLSPSQQQQQQQYQNGMHHPNPPPYNPGYSQQQPPPQQQ